MAKINVLTVTLKVDIPVDPGSLRSVQDAAGQAERLGEAASKVGRATVETRLNRVPEPEPKLEAVEPKPEPAAAELDIPENLRRVPKPATA